MSLKRPPEESLEIEVHKKPQKKYFRQRAHCNPLADHQFSIPTRPQDFDWSEHYPNLTQDNNGTQQVEMVDIGCGFGGFLIKLSAVFPDKLVLGMEIRDKVSLYVRERILHLRAENSGKYNNVSVIRSNTQKFLCNYFRKGQLSKMFFLFPDPHFKAANHRRRIINRSLIADYAYCLREGGMLYTVTDVPELAKWMEQKLSEHPLFEKISEEQMSQDKIVGELPCSSEEGQKVARNEGQAFISVFIRVTAK
eukprot:TRINITY_DN207_c1_g1_i3.p1 TRINITY_DN207_c1_g1~~TRINITY_DN207_c1_g1_i3.p1  ORF type:complete len:251 (+),score=28.40 TRINITY_DN207_c1_g1_i3:91-843(+)